jgi:hypothetical protein
MGQQLGLPAARATTQEVLGTGAVEPFTPCAWRSLAGLASRHVVAQEDSLAFHSSTLSETRAPTTV